MAFTTLTPEQRRAALAKAVQVRSERAQIKKDLKKGILDLTTVLNAEVVGKMKVLALLESLPRYGKVRARQLMDELGISPVRRVAGLSSRQRRDLEAHFSI